MRIESKTASDFAGQGYRTGLRAASIVFLLLLGACASTGSRVVHTGANVPLDQLEQWQAQGRLAAALSGSGGSGSFIWQQHRDHSFVQLAGPAGIGALRLTLDGTDLSIETGDGRKLQSAAAVAELEQRLGASIPTQKLRYWMLGRPAPGDHQWINESSDMPVLEQDGWRIEYQQFVNEAGVRLPVRFNAAAAVGRLRVIVDRWQLGT